jgi:hypothetical protein
MFPRQSDIQLRVLNSRNDAVKCAETLQKLIELRRRNGTRIQARSIQGIRDIWTNNHGSSIGR